MNQIIKDFGKGIKQLGQETGEKLVSETGTIAESIITAKELLGDIKPMSDEEINKKRMEDEEKKKREMENVRSQMLSRNVEGEVKQVRNEKEKEEEEKEKMFLENLRRQREEERQNQIINSEMMTPLKHHKDKGGNRRKTQQPDQSQMSQTAEYKGKID